uniref:Protein phosphatase n=1 Tax=Blastobotrys adeninivorans TaxID=409370 RepID=A0A060TDL0_BLAAD
MQTDSKMISRRGFTRFHQTLSSVKRTFRTTAITDRASKNSQIKITSTTSSSSTDSSTTTTATNSGPTSTLSSSNSIDPIANIQLTTDEPINDSTHSGDRLSFQMAEAYLPKMQDNAISLPEEARKRVSRDVNSKLTDRPDSGQDSFFHVQIDKGTKRGSIALGVADGVGGWATVGVDPSEYSHTLCELMVERFLEQRDLPHNEPLVQPLKLIDHAYEKIKKEDLVQAGSCTACVGVASPLSGILQVANLGDSGYAIFRQGRVYRLSTPLTHRFNTPYQLAAIPNWIKFENVRRLDDKPSDAIISTHTLQHGDVVVFSTDGLTDNLFAHEILNIVNDTMIKTSSWVTGDDGEIKPGKTMSGSADLAFALVKNAALRSVDLDRTTPFAVELRREIGITATGGKPDDITVVCLLVQDAQSEQDDS